MSTRLQEILAEATKAVGYDLYDMDGVSQPLMIVIAIAAMAKVRAETIEECRAAVVVHECTLSAEDMTDWNDGWEAAIQKAVQAIRALTPAP